MKATTAFLAIVALLMAIFVIVARADDYATVTAYCSECNTPHGTNDGRYGPLKKGDIAADPNYWKPGSFVFIEGIGRCRVRDTGGAIKGRGRFDVWLGFKSSCPCNDWGKRRLRYWEVD